MRELLFFLNYIIGLYVWVVIADVVLSILMQANIINPYQPTVRSLSQAFHSVTEPLLRPIRGFLPRSSGLDWSPLVLILACYFLQWVVIPNLAKLF